MPCAAEPASRMLLRPLGHSGINVSVIGFGSAQLRQVPEQQGLDTLLTAFELGVNIVHTAPDYEGAEALIAEAVAASGKEIIVVSHGYGQMDEFRFHYEQARARFAGRSIGGLEPGCLPVFGIACVDDRERVGENVWGPGGMVEFLAGEKRAGRLRASFCSTHGSPEYVRRLIESGAFDAIMLAYNPLGYHLLSHIPPAPGEGERLPETPALFALAAAHGVGLMLMKPLAGGLLLAAKAFPPHDPAVLPSPTLSANTVFRWLLNRHPAVSCVVPGMASPPEARENALAGHAPLVISESEADAVEQAVGLLRAEVCSRCGECEPLCRYHLKVSWLFRAAHIENHRAMTFETPSAWRYFDLHPEQPEAVCASCAEPTCRCPNGIDIKSSLSRVHSTLWNLRQTGRTGRTPPIEHGQAYAAALASWDIDCERREGHVPCCRLSIENTGTTGWQLGPGHPQIHLEVSAQDGTLLYRLPPRNNFAPGQACQFTFPLSPYPLPYWLTLDVREPDGEARQRISLGSMPPARDGGQPLSESEGTAMNDAIKQTASQYRVNYISHSIPETVEAGSICQFELELSNTSAVDWHRDEPEPDTLHLGLWIDDAPAPSGLLPQPILRPFEKAKVAMRFTAPSKPGPFRIKIDMVHQNITFFEAQGAKPLVLGCLARPAPPIPGRRYGASFTGHSCPATVRFGARFGVWLRIVNTGDFTWGDHHDKEKPVKVLVCAGETVISRAFLPRPIAPGASVDLHMVVLPPGSPGEWFLTVRLLHEGVCYFDQQGVARLEIPITVLEGPAPESARLFEILAPRNSWFYQPSAGIAAALDGRVFPLTLSRAEGCHMWDADGHRFIDFTSGWGCALLGHGHEAIRRAVYSNLGIGGTLPLPHRLEAEVTAMLCEDIPCAEAVAFGKNGSDVCTLAVRLARVVTGRKTILYCGYHGWQDWLIESWGMASTGVPQPPVPRTYRFPFNDLEAFQSLLAEHRGDLAAVMLEPSGPSGESPAGLGEEADPAFLRAVAEQTRAAGALLIFDEIITGFRVPGGGVQMATGVVPDLACFGKALANGLPLSALVGRGEIFRAMGSTFYGPTFKGETYALAAAKAALEIYRKEPVAERVCAEGRRLKEALANLCAKYQIDAKVVGPAFRFALHFTDPAPERRACQGTLWLQEMMKNGVLPYYRFMLPNLAHNDETFAKSLSAIEATLAKLAEADQDLHAAIEIPLLYQ